MNTSRASLTVCFEPPFWVALYQREEGRGVQVCRVTFGAEPRDQQVLDYFQSHWRELYFSPPVAAGPVRDRPMSPKRARREAGEAVRQTGAGTKAQQALQLQREGQLGEDIYFTLYFSKFTGLPSAASPQAFLSKGSESLLSFSFLLIFLKLKPK